MILSTFVSVALFLHVVFILYSLFLLFSICAALCAIFILIHHKLIDWLFGYRLCCIINIFFIYPFTSLFNLLYWPLRLKGCFNLLHLYIGSLYTTEQWAMAVLQ